MEKLSDLETRLVPERLPRHVAIIMDGNGRWARERGLSRIHGHRAGAESIREIVRAAGELDIPYLTLYAFSVDNWKRPAREVNALMGLLHRFLKSEEQSLNENNVRLKTIGRTGELPEKVKHWIRRVTERTAGNSGLTLVLALNYGGRSEIASMVRHLCRKSAAGTLNPDEIDESLIAHSLSTSGIPDPDLLIRTSGEMRVSDFLLWQISYTELHVTPVYWPAFKRRHFVEALLDYQARERRFGAVRASRRSLSRRTAGRTKKKRT